MACSTVAASVNREETTVTTPTSLSVFFVPWFGANHLLPLVDIARLFAARPGIRCTVLLTSANAHLFRPAIDRSAASGLPISTLIYPFTSSTDAAVFATAASDSFPAIEALIRLHRPDCIVSDSIFDSMGELSRDLRVPNVLFHALGLFPVIVLGTIMSQKPHLASSDDRFLVPGLPHQIYLQRSELPEFMLDEKNELMGGQERREQTQDSCLGVVVNSFASIESEYADHFRSAHGQKSWFVGPVGLAASRDDEGGDRHDCLSWLDSQLAGSVVYVCFGTWCRVTGEQIHELAAGLEKCGHPFLWVVRDGQESDLPEGLEGRVGGRGLVVRGWAPQVAVLNHESVGGFVTHCGWNSTLEAVTAGVPVVTWPLSTEQFVNEKLLVEVLRIGVKNWEGFRTTLADKAVTVPGDDVALAVGRIMGRNEEAAEMRMRAREFRDKAREAVKEGGPSYNGLSCLIEEIRAWPKKRKEEE